MSSFLFPYSEDQLLRRVQAALAAPQPRNASSASSASSSPRRLRRLKQKLVLRQLQRRRGLANLDWDQKMTELLQGSQLAGPKEPEGEQRPLDRYQDSFTASPASASATNAPHIGIYLTDGAGHRDVAFKSPYTGRELRPFIRREFQLLPTKLRLHRELLTHPKVAKNVESERLMYPVDFCYVRPWHVKPINNMARQFFWPGIDVSESLQYPDFSCVALYRKMVVGFAFLIPDLSHTEAYISFIFTHPDWRRGGIAKFMLYHLIQTCAGRDITLHVSANNPAVMLYQNFGFKVEERVLNFYDKYLPVGSKECKHALFLRLTR